MKTSSTYNGRTVSANSNNSFITVIVPPQFVTQLVSTTIDSGGTATLTVEVSGTSPSPMCAPGKQGVIITDG